MEEFRVLKEMVYFLITVVLLTLVCLAFFKLGKSIDGKIELNIKEREIIELEIENEKKNSKLLDKALEVNGIKQ